MSNGVQTPAGTAERRPRVLHVYKDYDPPVMGGIEGTINRMARGLLNAFDVSVLVCQGPCRAGEEVVDGVRVVRVAEWTRLLSAPVSPGFPAALRREAARADLLHFHHPNPTGDVAYLLVRPQVPAVMTYHSDVVRQRYAMAVYGAVQERMMRACRVIMPTSPDYLESSPWLQRHRERCTVVPLGVDLSRFEPTPELQEQAAALRKQFGAPLIIFVGRLRYYKGLEFLVRAMANVQAHAVIIGTGPDGERLRVIARDTGTAGRVHFLGDLPNELVVQYLYAAHIFCMPSHLRAEAFGLSMVEAMACGLPVVSADIPSGVRFVNEDGVTGLRVAPASPAALAEALNRLLGDPALRQRLGEGARARAHTMFSSDAMCRRLEQVYRSVLAKAAS
ncbi:MAG: glycosyltransferase [Candidatus Sumerlaeaceae bacterium]|nr:glycosyltransferase [Candidatus Sumerlaeaceae bacterium]